MKNDEQLHSVAVPGEWAIRALLGPVFTELGEDLRKLYAVGRDKIINAGYQKLGDPEDGKKANLRVARDVFWNGAFTDEEICAEYFGGVLAASRSNDGKDDSSIHFVTIIKSLSSSQLRLHYFIYTRLNQLLCRGEKRINVGDGDELNPKAIYFSLHDLVSLGVQPDTDFNVLYRNGLLHNYRTDQTTFAKTALPYASAHPTTYGVLLFAVAHNRLDEWHEFDRQEFGTFKRVTLPRYFAPTLIELGALLKLTP